MALKRGMPVEQVSKMLGHEELTTTQIYLDLDERNLEIAHEKYVVQGEEKYEKQHNMGTGKEYRTDKGENNEEFIIRFKQLSI